MKGRRNWVAALLAAAVLTACGGGGGGGGSTPNLVAMDLPAVTLNATQSQAVAAALSGQAVTFPNGLTINGVALPGPVVLTFTNSGNGFTLTDGMGRTASGTVTFSSVIFNVTTPGTTGLPMGQAPALTFAIDLSTGSQSANGNSRSLSAVITIGGSNSTTITITVTINADGSVVINSVTIGTASVGSGTGATGGG